MKDFFFLSLEPEMSKAETCKRFASRKFRVWKRSLITFWSRILAIPSSLVSELSGAAAALCSRRRLSLWNKECVVIPGISWIQLWRLPSYFSTDSQISSCQVAICSCLWIAPFQATVHSTSFPISVMQGGWMFSFAVEYLFTHVACTWRKTVISVCVQCS